MTIREYLENVLKLGIDLDTQMCTDDVKRTPFLQFSFATPERNAGEQFLVLQTKHDLDLSVYLEERLDALAGGNVKKEKVFREFYKDGVTIEDIQKELGDAEYCDLAEHYFARFEKEKEDEKRLQAERGDKPQAEVIQEVISLAKQVQEWSGEKAPEKDVTEKLMDAMAEYALEVGWSDHDYIDALVECGVTYEDFKKAGKKEFVKEYFDGGQEKEKGCLKDKIEAAKEEVGKDKGSGITKDNEKTHLTRQM